MITDNSLQSTHSLAIECLLSIIRGIAQRMPDSDSVTFLSYNSETIQQCRSQRQFKLTVHKAVEAFNRDIAEGFKALQGNENEIENFSLFNKILLETGLYDNQNPADVALFFRQAYGLNKTLIGEYIGKNKEFNIAVLDSFLKTFEFEKDEKFVISVRKLLESFRISGEAQIISRILERFAKHYCSVVPNFFENEDAAYVLAYSIIMLNVDQHKPGLKTRMTEADFIRMNRGTNNGKEWPPEFLSDIYHNIRTSEIKIAEEHVFMDNFINHIKLRNRMVKPFIQLKPGIFDQEIFATIRGPVVASISVSKSIFFFLLQIEISHMIFFKFWKN